MNDCNRVNAMFKVFSVVLVISVELTLSIWSRFLSPLGAKCLLKTQLTLYFPYCVLKNILDLLQILQPPQLLGYINCSLLAFFIKSFPGRVNQVYQLGTAFPLLELLCLNILMWGLQLIKVHRRDLMQWRAASKILSHFVFCICLDFSARCTVFHITPLNLSTCPFPHVTHRL